MSIETIENGFEQRLGFIQILINKGWTANIKSGEVFNPKGILSKSIMNNGYQRISSRIKNKTFSVLAHHFIYYLATGEIVKVLDHINCDRTDNRIDNLRAVSLSENQWNRKTVNFYFRNNRYEVYIGVTVDGVKKLQYIGTFKTKDEANKAYLDAKKEIHKK